MAQKKIVLTPRVAALLKTFGEDIRLARLRRNIRQSFKRSVPALVS